MQQAIVATHPSPARRGFGDPLFAALARASGGFVLLLLGGIILSLFIGGIAAFRQFGAGFVVSTDWDPVHQKFGALVSVYGTLVTSTIALLLAVPLAFGIAFYLTELAPGWLRRPVGTSIELLAAVPSIIYGMWGFFVIVPIMSSTIQPAIINAFDGIPVLQDLFAGPPFGTGIFTAALVPTGLAWIAFGAALGSGRLMRLSPVHLQRGASIVLAAFSLSLAWTVLHQVVQFRA